MHTLFRCIAARCVLSIAAFSSLPAPAAPAGAITLHQLRDDAEFIRQTIARAHPDPGFWIDRNALDKALDAIEAETRTGAAADIGSDEAWRRLAVLNPLFADAHLLVGYADWRAESTAHLAAGGAFFPYEVTIGADGELFIRALLGGAATPLAGTRILAIDDVPAASAIAALGARVHGDTPLFRSNLLARRWWFYHWKVNGAAPRYRLELMQGGRRWRTEAAAVAQAPAVLRDAGFERSFGLEIRSGCPAVLKAGSFDGAFKERFLAFTRAAFTRLRQEKVSTLVIDIGDNGGGDDVLWLEGLMPYLATRPYRTGSAYTKRVLETSAARGELAGQVVEGRIQTWYPPQTDNPLLFGGKVVVEIGPSTYSSAVLFANVMQDFGFADISGTGRAARRTQSGGIRKFLLPNSGLALWVPRFILAPPAGAARTTLMAPTIERDAIGDCAAITGSR